GDGAQTHIPRGGIASAEQAGAPESIRASPAVGAANEPERVDAVAILPRGTVEDGDEHLAIAVGAYRRHIHGVHRHGVGAVEEELGARRAEFLEEAETERPRPRKTEVLRPREDGRLSRAIPPHQLERVLVAGHME